MPSQDYEEFIAVLNAHGVKYLLVGAHAVAFHARPRATKDLDVLIEPTAANARRTLAALRDFFGGADLLQELHRDAEAGTMRALANAYQYAQEAHVRRTLSFTQGKDPLGEC